MEKKYELVLDEKFEKGKELYRIKALKDFSTVKKGELGGYVESEKNLSQEGDCWIYGNSMALNNSRVEKDAVILSDDCIISGNAIITNNATVKGRVMIKNNAYIFGNAIINAENVIIKGYASIGDLAYIKEPTDYIVITNIGSPQGTLTAYKNKNGTDIVYNYDAIAHTLKYLGDEDGFRKFVKKMYDKDVYIAAIEMIDKVIK